MKHLLLIAASTFTLAGCFVRSGPPQQRTTVVRESCPPAHHWEGGACVHNGKAKGHYK